ncbi:hypothetical protein LTR37_021450 [Vermiconidia calcicola]|uniref:Uncharacterized protein n=1 Tax=Vermiconidia calcicola TaxID=1690605 RepID=A0ACC3M8J7_9PEZI|nr:hypothetical protein LTR37_021450 [Vermiconidia calcicola]
MFPVLALLLAASAAFASPILDHQEVLTPLSPYRPATNTHHVAKYLDAAPNTVGVLFMNTQEEGVHVWFPLGERVYTRDEPILPLHPMTARITAMVAASPEAASAQHLESLRCRVLPFLTDSGATPSEFGLEFSRADGLVNFAEMGGLEGWEVESYVCE